MAKKEILKPFDLEKAKAGATVMTECYGKARIVCYDLKANAKNHPLLVLVIDDGIERPAYYKVDGTSDYYSCYGNLKIVEEVEVPDRWRDIKDATLYGYYINEASYIVSDDCRGGYSHDCSNRNVFATEKQAQSALAMAQISQIMANDKRFGGPLTDQDWLNDKKLKYTIRRFKNKVSKGMELDNFTPLAFCTEEQRNLFLKENQDLLKAYFML